MIIIDRFKYQSFGTRKCRSAHYVPLSVELGLLNPKVPGSIPGRDNNHNTYTDFTIHGPSTARNVLSLHKEIFVSFAILFFLQYNYKGSVFFIFL